MSKAFFFRPVLASPLTNQLTVESVFLADKGGSRHSPTACSVPASLGEEPTGLEIAGGRGVLQSLPGPPS